MNKKKIFITVAMLVIAYLLIQPTKAQAALQANGGTSAKYGLHQWITGIRQMQAIGGTLGLTDTINGTNLTSTNTNLDIHMQKNTEYGALILLSASSYGNPNKVESGGTTTGNATGVVMQINKEWVAAGTISEATQYVRAAGRYKNMYSTSYVAKKGDAIATVGRWHGASVANWLNFTTYCGLIRSHSGSIFSYYGRKWWKSLWRCHV